MVYKEKIHITNTSSTFRINEIKRKDIENETERERERDLYETMVFLCIVVLLLHFFITFYSLFDFSLFFLLGFLFFDLVLIYMQFYILIVTYLMNRQYIIISLYLSIITIILILIIIN